MKIKGYLLGLLFPLTWMACEKNILTDEEASKAGMDYLIGNWINPQYTDANITFQKNDTLKSQDYGFSFQLPDRFIERKNSGWCGTPPISYADFEGTWTRHDSILDIQVAYWGGTAYYKWKILAIDRNILTIEVMEEDFLYIPKPLPPVKQNS